MLCNSSEAISFMDKQMIHDLNSFGLFRYDFKSVTGIFSGSCLYLLISIGRNGSDKVPLFNGGNTATIQDLFGIFQITKVLV